MNVKLFYVQNKLGWMARQKPYGATRHSAPLFYYKENFQSSKQTKLEGIRFPNPDAALCSDFQKKVKYLPSKSNCTANAVPSHQDNYESQVERAKNYHLSFGNLCRFQNCIMKSLFLLHEIFLKCNNRLSDRDISIYSRMLIHRELKVHEA